MKRRWRAGARMDLIFSNIVMPGTIDGDGLATDVRTLYPDLQVVLRSATAMRADSASGFANSGDAGSRSHPRDCQARRAKQSRLNILATSDARMACETVTVLPALLEGRRHTMRQQGFEKDFPLPRDRILLKR